MKFQLFNKQVIAGIWILILVPGCGIYNTQTTDIPLINEKNDLRIDAGLSLIPSAQATISYGITNRISLQASGSAGIEDRYYFQAAPGFYKKIRNRNVIELYTGFGYGYGKTWPDRLSNYPLGYTRKLYGDYQLYFTQLNFGRIAVKSGQMDYGLGIKAGYFRSGLTDHNYYQFISESGPFPLDKENSILLEPVLFFRSGGEKVKFSFKFGLTRIFRLQNGKNLIPTPGVNMGFGINFRPNLKNRSKH